VDESTRILGIDPGERRIGLALSDPLGVTAQGL
jgi:RNase H-fold protein (predicted Holliday junction resolvase)